MDGIEPEDLKLIEDAKAALDNLNNCGCLSVAVLNSIISYRRLLDDALRVAAGPAGLQSLPEGQQADSP